MVSLFFQAEGNSAYSVTGIRAFLFSINAILNHVPLKHLGNGIQG